MNSRPPSIIRPARHQIAYIDEYGIVDRRGRSEIAWLVRIFDFEAADVILEEEG